MAKKTTPIPKKPRALTARERRFVDEYMIDLNATQAAIRAGYSERTAGAIGYENLTKPEIQSAITAARAAQQQRTQITADRVLQEVARLALYDPRKFFDADGRPKQIQDLDDDTAAVLAGLDVSEIASDRDSPLITVKKYKLPDKGANLERLMKHLGLFGVDNSQKVDPLASLLHAIASNNGSGFQPVKKDPERDKDAG
jgi:phage terminase small subunit